MKSKSTLIIILLMVSVSLIFGQNPPTNGLVGYFKFDEGDGDSLYNLAEGDDIIPNGIIYNPVWSDESVFGTSLYFDLEKNMPDELPSWIEFGTYDPTQGTNKLSFSCWIYWNGIDGEYHGITGKRDDWTNADVHWDLTLKRDGFYQFEALKAGDVKNYLLSPEIPQVGVWENFIVTYDGKTARMYVNGMPVSQGDMELGLKTDAIFLLGCAEPEGVTPFQGYIDEVRYYNRKLSDVEIWDIWTYDCSTPISSSKMISENNVSLYPNPMKDVLTINAEGLCMVQIYDISGEKVLSHELNGPVASVNTSSLLSGIYIIKVFGKENSVHKMIKR